MTFSEVLHSSDSNEWETPDHVFDHFDRRFSFDLDAAAAAWNYKVKNHFSKERCAFKHRWSDHGSAVWCNPPYGRRVGLWVERAYREAKEGKIKVVLLIMARTDTTYFHDYIMKANEVYFVKKRIKFERFDGHTGPAPCGSLIAVFDGRWEMNKPNFYALEFEKENWIEKLGHNENKKDRENEKKEQEAPAGVGVGY